MNCFAWVSIAIVTCLVFGAPRIVCALIVGFTYCFVLLGLVLIVTLAFWCSGTCVAERFGCVTCLRFAIGCYCLCMFV